jgi:hypothetical protein
MNFQRNKYNKPMNQDTMNQDILILSHNKTLPTLPLKMDIKIPINLNYNSPIMVDFKLKNYQMNKNIIQLNEEINKTQNNDQINDESNKKYQYYKNELIINIYGDASFDKILYNFLLELSKQIKIKIYIHTWDVDKNKLEYFFQGLNVVSIIVDKISDISNISGNIFSSNESLYLWKLMWTSMYRSMIEINKREDNKIIILNTKFNINYNFTINNLNNIIKNKFTKNLFLKDSNDLSGVDNPIIGDKDTLNKLINTFYNNLEDISMFYKSFTIPEASIYYENNRLFGVNINNMFENIEKYSK